MSIEPRERQIVANGLGHHVIEWNGGNRGDFVLCHGFLDLAWSYRALAARLAADGFRVFAFDWRGHGESEWVGPGGYYHFFDYLLDLKDLTDNLGIGPFHLVGHSMGATAAAYFAGTCSSRLRSVTLIEGLGPPEGTETAPDRMNAWFETIEKRRDRRRRPLRNLDEAVKRMSVLNPGVPDELGRFLAERNTEPNPDGDGIVWRFDPLHQTRSPIMFRLAAFTEFLRGISVPTLLVGAEYGFRLPDEKERAASIKDHRWAEISDSGHMVHWFQPETLHAAILQFVCADATD